MTVKKVHASVTGRFTFRKPQPARMPETNIRTGPLSMPRDDQMPANAAPTIVVLAAPGLIPVILINALATVFRGRVIVIEERPEGPIALARRRARRLGVVMALGQTGTAIASRLLKKTSHARIAAILTAYRHQPDINPDIARLSLASINDAETRSAIARLKPGVIVTIACRILGRETLATAPCPILNFHAGINPAYRGQMGAYWALALGDPENFGATIHLVDAGIDTGATLCEVRVKPDPSDTMATYPLLLAAAGAKELTQAVHDALSGNLRPIQPEGPSKLHYPPTLWRWIWTGITRGIW